MDNKTIEKTRKFFLFSYLVMFPFGQLPSLFLNLFTSNPINLHICDLLLAMFVLLSFLSSNKVKSSFRNSTTLKLLYILLFTSLVGASVFQLWSVVSALYLLRIIFYLLFAFVLSVDKQLSKKDFSTFAISTAIAISVIGLLQYVFLPDTRFLKILGWDDHYYRLISTFLDPAFTAILLVFSFLYAAFEWKENNKICKISLLLLISVSLLLTYSRAGYLSLFVGSLTFILLKSKVSLKYIILCLGFILILFLLPRPGGEGVKLERTFSVGLKIQNSIETTKIISISPVFGVGYNNICLAREKYLQQSYSTQLYSHSCAGADNTLLFMLATLGISGTLSIIWWGSWFVYKLKDPVVFSILGALLVHTQFTNTLFYPWVFAWIVLLITSKD